MDDMVNLGRIKASILEARNRVAIGWVAFAFAFTLLSFAASLMALPVTCPSIVSWTISTVTAARMILEFPCEISFPRCKINPDGTQ